jgi:hypothetical protein
MKPKNRCAHSVFRRTEEGYLNHHGGVSIRKFFHENMTFEVVGMVELGNRPL